MTGLTHLDESGRARMVDVSDKDVTQREATARAIVSMQPNHWPISTSSEVPNTAAASASLNC